MNININLNSPSKPAVTIESLCALLNRKVESPGLFKVAAPNSICFEQNANVHQHTLLIGLLVILSAKHYGKYGFFVALGGGYGQGRNSAGAIKSLDTQAAISVVYDFVDRLDLDEANIEIS